MRVRSRRQLGNIFEDIADAGSDAVDAIGGAASAVVNAISDAGAEIGAVLKFIAPIVALIPGLGTAASLALTAAGAYAAGDSIPDAIVEIAAGAMPGPIAKAAFVSAADLVRTAVEGGDVGDAAIRACRSAADTAGGPRAVAAFDLGLDVAQGEPIGDSAWAMARNAVAQNGTAALAAFDAAVALKNGGGVAEVSIAIARAYIASSGGAAALVAFDTGVAIAAGKSLQDAGFDALKAFVAGNDVGQRAVVFLEKMRKAAIEGKSLLRVLTDELATEVGQYGVAQASATLGPIIDEWNPNWNFYGVDVLAERLGVSSLMAQAAQAIMRNGAPDEQLWERLTRTPFSSLVEKFGARTIASRELNESYAEAEASRRSDLLMLLARMPASSLSYHTAEAEQYAAPIDPSTFVHAAPSPPLLTAGASRPAGAPRTSAAGDVALGATVAAACLALVWWARSS